MEPTRSDDPAPGPVTTADLSPPQPLRLHAWSWLFALLTQLRTLLFPAVAFLVFGRGAWWELFAIAGAVVLALYSLIYSIGFRYRLGRDEITVKEGIFFRTERHIPHARIQNIVERRNPLHRLFGVTELRLESAGGLKPEAVMNVITRDAAERIRATLRGSDGAATESAAATDSTEPLLALTARDIVRLGLVTNRGAVVVGALFAAAFQFEPWNTGGMKAIFRLLYDALRFWSHTFAGPVALVASALVAAIAFGIALKLLSILMSFLSFHGFRLSRHGDRVATEGGLLTRHAASARLDKVQRLLFGENWLARRLGIRWMACDVATSAASMGEDTGTRLRWLAPVATPAQLGTIVADLAPGLDIDRMAFRPLHPRAIRRVLAKDLLVSTLMIVPLIYPLRWWCIAVWLLLVTWSVFEARGWVKFAGYAFSNGVFAFRSGWWTRQWTVARIAKGQGIQLSVSPFDRRHGMATVELDTAGQPGLGIRLRVPYLAESEARTLAEGLQRRL